MIDTLLKGRRIHFMGAGGIGVSALMHLVEKQGAIISGCDLKKNSSTNQLSDIGIPIEMGHHPSHLIDVDMLVVSSAIPSHNLELQFAHEKGIMVLSRSQFLQLLMKDVPSIGVTGSHGKTTTTDILAHIFLSCQRSPTVAVGGISSALNQRNFLLGSDWFISELDESDGSMLHATPQIGVITNIDREHVDHYGDMAGVMNSFRSFVHLLDSNGTLILCGEDHNAHSLKEVGVCRKMTYGFQADFSVYATNCEYALKTSRFCLHYQGKEYQVVTSLRGRHNVLNVMAAVCAGLSSGLEIEEMLLPLASYQSVKRRLEICFGNGPVVIDDYAHHPTEIMATLESCRQMKTKKIIGVFQAHRYTRLNDLWAEFIDALKDFDEVIVVDIYSANEDPIEGVTADRFAKELLQNNTQVQYIPKAPQVIDYLKATVQPEDLVISLGAGDVNQIVKSFSEWLIH